MRILSWLFIWCITLGLAAQEPALVSIDETQKLHYNKYANQGESDEINQIPDFSWAGYQMGGVALPQIAVRIHLEAIEGDNRAHIQAAIDEIASLPEDINGFRGAIILKGGLYRCSGPLYISSSGIILRGEKQDLAEYGGTQLIATATYQHDLIQCKGNVNNLTNKPQALDTLWIPQEYTNDHGQVIDGQLWLSANILKAAQKGQENDGQISLQITTNLNDYSSYSSKEGSKSPYLEVVFRKEGSNADSTRLILPSDDAFVRGGEFTNQNFGTDDELVVKYNGDGSEVTRETFLKFQLPSFDGTIISASLKLWCRNAGKSGNIPHYVYATSATNWDETNINYGNKPNLSMPQDRILDSKIGVGSRKIRVENSSKYTVGQQILLTRTPNQKWIDALAMGQYGWTPTAYRVSYPNTIIAIAGDTLTLSVPIVHTLDQYYGGAEIENDSRYGFLSKVGIENMLITSAYTNDEDEAHGWSAIHFTDSRNCWVKNVTAQFFGYACVQLSNVATTTVQDCAMLDPKAITTGSRKYSFSIDKGSFNLFQRCYTRGGRHDFVTGSQVAGPNVFLDCLAQETSNDIGPHHRYATGILFDNIIGGQMRVQNRKDMGTGHGWAGAQVMFWNVEALDAALKVESPIGALNWGIGCRAGLKEGAGYWGSWLEKAYPRSLYLQQLQDRLGQNAVNNIATTAQIDGTIHHYLEQWKGLDHRISKKSTPYIKHTLPGKIECEHFDFGINGEAYTDLSPQNNGLSLRPTAVDIYSQPTRISGRIEHISFVGNTEIGEILNYTLQLLPGNYSFEVQYASLRGGEQIALQLNAQRDTLNLASTGSLLDFERANSLLFRIEKDSLYTLSLLCLDSTINLDWIASEQSNTSIKRPQQQDLVSIYPNPSEGIIHIKGKNLKDLRVVDIYGRPLTTEIRIQPSGGLITMPSHYSGTAFVYGLADKARWSRMIIIN